MIKVTKLEGELKFIVEAGTKEEFDKFESRLMEMGKVKSIPSTPWMDKDKFHSENNKALKTVFGWGE